MLWKATYSSVWVNESNAASLSEQVLKEVLSLAITKRDLKYNYL
jgi:hypothetical protein